MKTMNVDQKLLNLLLKNRGMKFIMDSPFGFYLEKALSRRMLRYLLYVLCFGKAAAFYFFYLVINTIS